MKIEIGESLMYSWLRHVKGCQIAQNNWKTSPLWNMQHFSDLQAIMDKVKSDMPTFDVFKKNNIAQFMFQGECDAIGISYENKTVEVIAADVAFHRGGLNYGSREKTTAKVLEKCIRTAMCIYGFFGIKNAEIYFITPKIGKKLMEDVKAGVDELQKVIYSLGYSFQFKVLANDEFKNEVLDPVLLVSDKVDDTSELFLRSKQLLQMFENTCESSSTTPVYTGSLKIGKLAQTVFADILTSGKVSAKEISDMQTKSYSKNTFDLQFPVLVSAKQKFDQGRYYATPIKIGTEEYYLCSQWFETTANNDRPYLEAWIDAHK